MMQLILLSSNTALFSSNATIHSFIHLLYLIIMTSDKTQVKLQWMGD